MKFYCNKTETEINFWNSKKERITIKFHFGAFETDDKETIKFLSGYQREGVLVSVSESDLPKQEETEKEDESPSPIVRTKSTAGKRK